MPALSTIKIQPLRWLWPHHIPLGKFSLLVGEQGSGKTFVALDLAARVSSGSPWPNHQAEASAPGGVLLVTPSEDLADITCPRLVAAGGNLQRITVPEGLPSAAHNDDAPDTPPAPFDVAALEREIQATPNCRLVVIDPIGELLSSLNSKSPAQKRPDWPAIFKALASLAARTGVAIVATLALIPSTSAAANHRAVATLAAHPGPACVWRVTTDPQDPELRLLTPVKNNLAPRNAPLMFRLETTASEPTAKIAWQPAASEPISAPTLAPQRHKPIDQDPPALHLSPPGISPLGQDRTGALARRQQ